MIFIIADGLNTSYIDSLLMGLFYKKSHLEEMLAQFPEDIKFTYLQELINNIVIELARKDFSIDSSLINEIRNYSIICGWKQGQNILELYNVVDYLDFLITGFNFGYITFEIIEIHNEIQTETSKLLQLNYIQINVGSDSDTKTLLNKWIDNILFEKTSDDLLTYYHFKELPMFVTMYLNRNDNNQINNCLIDIKKKIKFYKNNDKSQQSASWIIHCIICYSSSGNGKYYTIINQQYDSPMSWYMFNNDKIPSMTNIDIRDKNIATKIKQECVLIIYRLEDTLSVV